MKKLHKALESLRSKRELPSEEGFSFIELVIVVAVIGILTAIAIPSYGGIQATARQNAVAATAQQAYSAGVAAFAQGKALGNTDGSTENSAAEAAEKLETSDIEILVEGSNEDSFKVTASWPARDDVNPVSRGGGAITPGNGGGSGPELNAVESRVNQIADAAYAAGMQAFADGKPVGYYLSEDFAYGTDHVSGVLDTFHAYDDAGITEPAFWGGANYQVSGSGQTAETFKLTVWHKDSGTGELDYSATRGYQSATPVAYKTWSPPN